MYSITKPYLGYTNSYPITEEQFNRIKAAHINLIFALSFEEKLSLVTDNYEEFERELFAVNLHRALSPVYSTDSWSNSMEGMHSMNRRVVNFLTTTKLYLDQVCHSLSTMYGKKSNQLKEFKKFTNEQYDAQLGYRVMEALRNYVQHQDLPFSKIGGHIKIVRDENDKVYQYQSQVTPLIVTSRLRENNSFKKETFVELEKLGAEIDIKPFVREYFEGLYNVHKRLREMLSIDVAEWDAIIQSTHDDYKKQFDEDTGHIVAIEQDSGGKLFQTINLMLKSSERRALLAEQNNHEYPLDKMFFTSE